MTTAETDAPLPILIDERKSDGVVSVRLLLELPDGRRALVDGEGYFRIGQIQKTVHYIHGAPKEGHAWYWDEEGYGGRSGVEKTHAAALAALLAAANYTIAPPNAANEALF